MKTKTPEEIRQSVGGRYSKIAQKAASSCGCSPFSSCCGTSLDRTRENTEAFGYTKEQLDSAPEGANLGLGCGNPQAIASLREGETVLDLGSGAGFDCFLVAKTVGDSGRVIGVDMTPDMVSKARQNALRVGVKNVEFRLGEIEHLPVADGSVDVIVSNCVINLSPEKPEVFREAMRVLKPGGRLAILDVVATKTLPVEVREDLALISGCIGGAEKIENIEKMLQEAGFQDITIHPKEETREFIREWSSAHDIGDYVVSATIEAIKPYPDF